MMPRRPLWPPRMTHLALLAIVAIIATGFGFLLDQLMRDVRQTNDQATEETLIDTANSLAAVIEPQWESGGPSAAVDTLRAAWTRLPQREVDARVFDLHKTRIGLNVCLTDADGRVLYDSSGVEPGTDHSALNDVKRTLDGKYGARATRLLKNDPDSSVVHVAAPVLVRGVRGGVLSVSKAKSDQMFFVVQRRRDILWATALIAAGLLLFLVAVFAWLFRPMQRLAEYARAVSRGERPTLPRLGRGQEAGVLGHAVEEMREELEGRHYAGRYVRTLTHELKSPLAAIRGAAELLGEEMPADQRRRFLENILTESARADQIIARLLRLSEIEQMKALERREPLDLRAIAEDAAAEMQSRNVRLAVATEGVPEPCEGDPFLLGLALLSLVENSCDLSPPNGTVIITVEPCGWRVEDEGPGIPDYAAERVFERFYSLKHQHCGTKGSGLGLCLVQEIAQLHGGGVTLENRPSGGAVARLRLGRRPSGAVKKPAPFPLAKVVP